MAWLLALCIGDWLGWYFNYTCHWRVHARFKHAKKPSGLNESSASPVTFSYAASCLPPSDTAGADCIYQVCSTPPQQH